MKDHGQLREIAVQLANRPGISLAFDTQYDAGSCLLYWWRGNTRFAIDLQPQPDGTLEVRRLCSQFPWPGRLLSWAHSAIPMFPFLGVTESLYIGSLPERYSASQVAALVAPALPTNWSFKPTCLWHAD